MTDFSQPINYGRGGPWLAAATQILNAVGALTLVYAFRYGKAIVVSPLTNAGAPSSRRCWRWRSWAWSRSR